MNLEPHSHTPRLERSGWPAEWEIVYGDQYRYFNPKRKNLFRRHVPSIEEQLRTEVQAMIRAHDRATQRELDNYRMVARLTPSLNPKRWGSEQLKGR